MSDEPFDPWGEHVGLCPEWGFDRDRTDDDPIVGHCVRVVVGLWSGCGRVVVGLWSASRYVGHTVDVLRCGTERFWTISADPAFGVPTFDEHVLAETRSSDHLSPVVGLIALIAAADAWHLAALETPHDNATPHPEAGTICARCGLAPRARGAPPPGISVGAGPAPEAGVPRDGSW